MRVKKKRPADGRHRQAGQGVRTNSTIGHTGRFVKRKNLRVSLPGSGSARGKGGASAPPAPRTPRPKILVLQRPPVRPDGPFEVEVYSENRQVDVCIATLLDGLPETELLREAYMESRLPYRFRDLFLPRNLCAAAAIEPRTAEQELARVGALRVLRELRSLQAKD